jgi:hypothetical protein
MTMGERVYPEDLLRHGGAWLGALRNRIKWMRCWGNGESITWGSDTPLDPPLTMAEVEQLGAVAAAAALDEAAEQRAAKAGQVTAWRLRPEAEVRAEERERCVAAALGTRPHPDGYCGCVECVSAHAAVVAIRALGDDL